MKKAKILCLDGGGIRGIIPATIIQYVEEKAQELTQNPNLRIADLFDFIAGTSTGGILTCLYLTPNYMAGEGQPNAKYTAQEALDLYVKNGYDIFNKSKIRWYNWKTLFNATQYSPHYLEKIAKEKFGDLKFSELLKPALITTYDLKSESTFFFSSREPLSKKREFYVRDVARSTSAAPTYFPPARIKNLADPAHDMINLDGGVFANNPTMCAYAEARDTKEGPIQEPSATNMIILSLGTGGGNLQIKGVNASKSWGLLKWAEHIPDIMMDGSADTVAYQIQSIFNTLGEPKRRQYLRVDVPYQLRKTYSSDMGDASPMNISDLQDAAEATLAIKKAELDQMIRSLVAELETEKAHA
ncbi:patatin-like phospholipase family protein [Reichenbachiella agarivorans]|uniref:Patatin-like phospholipase family protein n=1 Tax=Reichenbachiella agarivorans TaxID=2979464 RepID=A0ABY6CTU2_9BACT|nr:patatin-like phospholipase family protein [Reichenbachiella agarivorans]UXP31665.1 patatin-like phospholipase family protein [Reichenbachiella agarivorans]